MAKTWSGYKLHGRTKFQGLPISIENERGTMRSGVNKDGTEWCTFMHIPYGYIRMTEGTDGDHVDCYIGPNPHSDKVFIVHQQDPDTEAYDEDKVMLGFNSARDARKAYTRQYDRPGFFQSMTTVDMEDFKDMIKNRYGMKLKKSLEKAKRMPIGTVSHGRKKVAEGKWVAVTNPSTASRIIESMQEAGRQVADRKRRYHNAVASVPIGSTIKGKGHTWKLTDLGDRIWLRDDNKTGITDEQLLEEFGAEAVERMLTKYGVKMKKSVADELKRTGLYKEGKTKVKVDPKELAAGIKVEMEHTDDREAAKQIALDHLVEDAHYYSKLKKIESKMEKAVGDIAEPDPWIIDDTPYVYSDENRPVRKSGGHKYIRRYKLPSGKWGYVYPKEKKGRPQAKTNFDYFKALDRAESDVIKLSNDGEREAGMALDRDGNVLHTVIGTADEIRFEAEDKKRMRGARVFTHNHPKGYSLSVPDILTSINYGIREIRAVSNRDGNVYSYRPDFDHLKSRGWDGGYNASFMDLVVGPVKEAEEIVRFNFWQAIDSGSMTREQATELHNRTVIETAMATIGGTYTETDSAGRILFSRRSNTEAAPGERVAESVPMTKALVPVRKPITRKGKTFMVTYWVSPQEMKQLRAQHSVPKDAPLEIPASDPIPEPPIDTTVVSKSKDIIDYAPDSKIAVDKIIAYQRSQVSEDVQPNVESVRETAARELEYALSQRGDTGQGWYSDKINETRAVLAQAMPELADDNEWSFFAALLALSSPRNPVSTNMNTAVEVYSIYKQTGRIPIKQPSGKGWPGPTMDKTLTRVQGMIDDMGFEGFVQWMSMGSTGEKLKQINPSIKEATKTGFYPNAKAFGPKVGAFYNNLIGNFSLTTIDMWAARSWHRWNNSLKKVKNSKGMYEIDVSVNKQMRANADALFDSLGEEFGLSRADVQAVLWYYEKRLYTKLGAGSAMSEDIGYDEAAKRAYESITGRGRETLKALVLGWEDADVFAIARRHGEGE